MRRRTILAISWSLIALLAMVGWQEWTLCRGRSPDSCSGRSPGRATSNRQQSGHDGSKSQAPDRTTDTDRKVGTEDEPPLLLEDDPPLLLDDNDDDASSTTGGPVADNSRCHVCHLDYAVEEIAVVHAKANLGCTKCHGDCDEHIADESWASGGNGTPPGKMYRRQDIDPCCEECHKEHDVPARDVVARWLQRCSKEPKRPSRDQTESVPRPIGKKTADHVGIGTKEAAPNKTVCTDCHGHHRLKERTCKWK